MEKYVGIGHPLKISEDKIDAALADIKDVEMRLKIETIVKSFKEICE
jgi:hypothetical protein